MSKRSGANITPAELAYSGPPDYRAVARHDAFPQQTHDEIERLNFLSQFNAHLSTRVLPFVESAWRDQVGPEFEDQMGRAPKDRHEVRRALLGDPTFQTWSALRRLYMEQRQQAGRWTTLRQAEDLAERIDALIAGDEDRISLNPALPIPRYVSAVDHHCMPGSYHFAAFPGDVSGAANYDHALFATTGGALGRYTDGGGRGVARWMKRTRPDFQPKRIVDLGCTVGHSLLPIAQAYPDAEVIGADVAAPVLRYALARAKALGIDNVRFIQADGADLSMLKDASVDWVQSTMFLHELSLTSMRAIFRESHRLLRPGGIVAHAEQPQYTADMPFYQQAMRDWDAFYNNEPFWSTLHEIDLDAYMVEAGFAREKLIHDGIAAPPDIGPFSDPAEDGAEDFGRKAAWRVIGAEK